MKHQAVQNGERHRLLGVALAGVLATGLAATAHAQPAADPAVAVRAAFQAYDDDWRTGKTQAIVDAFADDFEWTNSVGVRLTDKAQFKRFLDHLFKDAKFTAGQDGPLVIHKLVLIGDDVAIVSCSESTFGQKDYRTGKVVPEQRSNELTVMRRIGGRWLIVNDLTSDESHGI
jgi:uncharacterized protein (TIGR02246 family)